MIRLLNYAGYKSIICLDGELPPKHWFDKVGLPIISADGASNGLIDMGITPDITVGDLDSLRNEYKQKIKIYEDTNQQTTDYQKSYKYAKSNNLTPAIVCGLSGGNIDHVLNNINIFSLDTENIFISGDIIGCIASTDEYDIPIGRKVSIIGIPECEISTIGLKWELKNYQMKFPGATSCSNRVISNPVKVKIHSGKALMMVYMKDVMDAGVYLS